MSTRMLSSNFICVSSGGLKLKFLIIMYNLWYIIPNTKQKIKDKTCILNDRLDLVTYSGHLIYF